MPPAPRPDKVLGILDDIFTLSNRVGEDYRWMHGAAYERRNSSDQVGGSGGGTSDPVHGIIVGQQSARDRTREAARLIADARSALIGAAALLTRAAGAIDNRGAEVESPRDHRMPRRVTKAELEQTRMAKLRRHQRGEGYGDAA